jgi:hypothetical protein
MTADTKQYPIWTCSAWGTSPRMAAAAFADEHFADGPRKVEVFNPDGTFRLVDGFRVYRVATQPGVPFVSEAAHGIYVVVEKEEP